MGKGLGRIRAWEAFGVASAAGVALFALPQACGGGTEAGPGIPQGPDTSFADHPDTIQPGVSIGQLTPAPLTLQYVERLPKIDYVLHSTDPATEGWPAEGDQVTWRAHLKNWSTDTLKDVDIRWMVEGLASAPVLITLDPGSDNVVDLLWTWTRQRTAMSITVDATHRFTPVGGARNTIAWVSDALSIGFYVEQSFYDYFRAHQHELGIGNSSFEDWAQLQIADMNQVWATGRYREAPNGVQDRVRLDAIHLVADGALPLDPAAFTIGGTFDPHQARPNVSDRTVDLQWGFPASILTQHVYDGRDLGTNNQFYYSGFIQHEMGHARYLIDVYAFNVYDGTNGSSVDIIDNGLRVATSMFMPGEPINFNGVDGNRVYHEPFQGLMVEDWRYLDRYSAIALNRIAGYRPVDGNFNYPANVGVFLNSDLPAENELTLIDPQGRPLAGARVQVFQAQPGTGNGFYRRVFDSVADLEFTADADGVVRLGRNPFTTGGPIIHSDDPASYSNAVIILRIARQGPRAYIFLTAADFNMEYWRGHTAVGQYTRIITLR